MDFFVIKHVANDNAPEIYENAEGRKYRGKRAIEAYAYHGLAVLLFLGGFCFLFLGTAGFVLWQTIAILAGACVFGLVAAVSFSIWISREAMPREDYHALIHRADVKANNGRVLTRWAAVFLVVCTFGNMGLVKADFVTHWTFEEFDPSKAPPPKPHIRLGSRADVEAQKEAAKPLQ
jgi:hypothetical protein